MKSYIFLIFYALTLFVSTENSHGLPEQTASPAPSRVIIPPPF